MYNIRGQVNIDQYEIQFILGKEFWAASCRERVLLAVQWKPIRNGSLGGVPKGEYKKGSPYFFYSNLGLEINS